jgi:hypothetical protein
MRSILQTGQVEVIPYANSELISDLNRSTLSPSSENGMGDAQISAWANNQSSPSSSSVSEEVPENDSEGVSSDLYEEENHTSLDELSPPPPPPPPSPPVEEFSTGESQILFNAWLSYITFFPRTLVGACF